MKKSKELVLKLQEGAKLRGVTCIPPDFDRVMFAPPCAILLYYIIISHFGCTNNIFAVYRLGPGLGQQLINLISVYTQSFLDLFSSDI